MNKLDICNRALLMLKKNFITALDEDTLDANYCNFLYDNIKAEVLGVYPWSCALKKVSLQSINQKGGLGYPYTFKLPQLLLKAIYVNNTKDYQKVGDLLFCKTNNIDLIYTYNIEEEKLDSYVAHLITLKLALELSYSINNDMSYSNNLKKLYDENFAKACNLDSKNGANIILEKEEGLYFSTWIGARD